MNIANHRLFFSIFLISFSPLLSNCATASRGTQTYFVVETLPAGAKVSTDMKVSGSHTNEFYGCPATPCKINMSRRSQFNVMLTKDGYVPFFYVVQKRAHKELKKDFENRKAFSLNTNGDIISSEELSANAGISPTKSQPSLSAATGTALGAWYTGGSISAFASGGVLTTPLIAGPALLTGYGIDLTSGALIDLTPNPMIVKLTPEQNQGESERLAQAFHSSRNK